MANHHFNVDEAIKYGVEKAILIYNIRFWLEKNKANRTNIRAGYYWTYNSSKAFNELFPYLNKRSIRRWLQELEDDGFLLSDCYNDKAYDNTKWYTIPSEFKLGQNGQGSRAPGQNSNPVGQNSQSSGQNGQPIPDNNTDIKPDVCVAVAPNKKTLEERRIDFQAAIKPHVQEFGRELCNEFYGYWAEVSMDGKKMKFEFEKTWEVYKRLKRWKKVDDEKKAKLAKSGKPFNDPSATPTVASSPESYHQPRKTV